MKVYRAVGLASVMLMLSVSTAVAQGHPMGFFITSVGIGNGGNLGGLEGADAHCQQLAAAAGADERTWRAYLSTEAPGARGLSACAPPLPGCGAAC